MYTTNFINENNDKANTSNFGAANSAYRQAKISGLSNNEFILEAFLKIIRNLYFSKAYYLENKKDKAFELRRESMLIIAHIKNFLIDYASDQKEEKVINQSYSAYFDLISGLTFSKSSALQHDIVIEKFKQLYDCYKSKL